MPSDVLCIGGINLDRKLKALHPLRPGSSNACTAYESAGGVARNVAENLARLGLAVSLAGQVGRDAAAQAVLAPLQALSVDTRHCLVADSGNTGSYTAVLDDQGQLVMGMADMALTQSLLPAQLETMQGALDARLWLADMNLPQPSLSWLAQQAHTREKKLVMLAVSEPKMRQMPRELRGVNTLLLNRGELAALGSILGWANEPAASIEAAVEFAFAKLRALGLQNLVVTQGKSGVWCVDANQTRCAHLVPQVPSSARVVDETGAGDALCAGLCASYLRYPADVLAAHVQRALRLAVLTVQSFETVSLAITPELI